uniref:Pentatricopeptide repeat-containing protein n=1 Tax=Chenopodium quinoa TaxID=63459 RepID=A0A803KPL7_CHEQI
MPLILQRMSKILLGLTLNKSSSLLLTFSSNPYSFIFGHFRIIRLSYAHIKFLSTTNHSSTDTPGGLIDSNALSTSSSYYEDTFSSKEFSQLRDCIVGSSDSSLLETEQGNFSADAALISGAINESNNVFEFKTQNFLRKFRDKLSEPLLIDVMKLIKNPKLSVQFFLWAGQQVGYSHTTPVYDALLEVMGCDQDDRIPKHFLQDIQDEDRGVLEKLLNVLVRKCCRDGRWNVALEELGRLKDFGHRPSRSTYNALVQVFVEAGRLDTACLLHLEMSNVGFKMDISTLNSFAYALCKAGKWGEALDLVEKEDFVPDTKLYTTMISGLCEASLFDEAIDILNKMRCSSSLPNVVTYRVLLCGCLKKKKLGRCKKILSMMIAEGCYPNRRIFNSLIHAYCASSDYFYAYKLLENMANCGCQPGYLVYNILIGGICCKEELPSSYDLELAEQVYAEMIDRGLVLNKVNVSSFSRCLCEAGKFDKAYNVIQEMTSKGFVPDNSSYSKVIEFLCNNSQVQKAFLLFEEMKRSGITPDVYTYTILIDGFCKAGLIAQARKWFNEMVLDGCSPNVVTYTTLIHAYLKACKIGEANELFEMMLSDGCVPNVVTYTALIDGYCKSGNIDKASQIYARMRGQENLPDVDMYFKVNFSEVNAPNVFTYGALVDGLCKAHKVKDAHNLLDAMFADGCEPNNIVYDALIDGFCKVGELDKAQEILTKMSERGYSPDIYTYASFIDKMLKDKRMDLALTILSKMLESDCAPNVVIYTEMIDGLCKLLKTGEAYKLMQMMDEKGCSPNVVTYTAMIDGFGKAGKIERCLELFNLMHEKGCAPNYVTYRVLINHCCSFGLLDKAHDLLEDMKQTYWPMHVASYQKVIEGFSQEFIVSLGLLDVLSDNEPVPIAPVYKVLIDSFCKAGRLDIAVQLCKEISSFAPIHTVAHVYSSLIESLCLASKVDEGFELFADMTRNRGVPEPSVFFHLIIGLIKLNRWEEALQISHSTCLMGSIKVLEAIESKIVIPLVSSSEEIVTCSYALQILEPMAFDWNFIHVDHNKRFVNVTVARFWGAGHMEENEENSAITINDS